MSEGNAARHAREITEGQVSSPVEAPRNRARRSRRRTIECLRCGTPRRVGPVEGECPSCGYLGWKPGRRRLAIAAPPAR